MSRKKTRKQKRRSSEGTPRLSRQVLIILITHLISIPLTIFATISVGSYNEERAQKHANEELTQNLLVDLRRLVKISITATHIIDKFYLGLAVEDKTVPELKKVISTPLRFEDHSFVDEYANSPMMTTASGRQLLLLFEELQEHCRYFDRFADDVESSHQSLFDDYSSKQHDQRLASLYMGNVRRLMESAVLIKDQTGMILRSIEAFYGHSIRISYPDAYTYTLPIEFIPETGVPSLDYTSISLDSLKKSGRGLVYITDSMILESE